jgi:hypothetical protein
MRPARVHPASLIHAVHHIVWSTNAEGRLRFGNSAWSRLIGFPCGVDVEAALAARIHFSDRKRRSEQWRHALDSREPYEVEYRLELSEGKAPCWYLEQGTPVRVAEDGLPVGWAVIATPIGAAWSATTGPVLRRNGWLKSFSSSATERRMRLAAAGGWASASPSHASWSSCTAAR